MVVCKFWQRGSCRNGERCNFEHPPRDQGASSNSNRFAALQTPDTPTARNNTTFRGEAPASRSLPFQLDKAGVIADLSTERPQWILSAYGPGRNAPEQLFGGPIRERSFEEMRLLHLVGVQTGNPRESAEQADKLVRDSELQIQNALNNIDRALQFIISAENVHPNRFDVVRASIAGELSNQNLLEPTQFHKTPAPGNTFGGSSLPVGNSSINTPATAPPSGAFGQPSAIGQKSNPFGAPSQPQFGAPSQSALGAFGQPSLLGQKPNVFGTPSSGPRTPFSPFASNVNTISQQPQPQPAAQNPFGAPSQPAASNPFQKTNQFVQAPGQAANPFRQNNPAPNPFMSHEPLATNSSSPTAKGFQTSNAFTAQASNSHQNQFAASSEQALGGNSESIPGHPALNAYASIGPGGTVTMFKGRRVDYRDGVPGTLNRDGTWEKIWFPQGPPAGTNGTEMEESNNTENLEAEYEYVRKTGSFKDGVMPLIPPKREWCLWDF